MSARLITSIAAVAVAIGLAGCSSTGGAPTAAAPTTVTPTSRIPVAVSAAQEETIDMPTVRDGALEFTVHGFRYSGEFVIVDLTVRNVGSEPRTFYALHQSLITGGKQYRPDLAAMVGMNMDTPDAIHPGLAVDYALPFGGLAVSQQPEAIILNDIRDDLDGVVVVSLEENYR